jgi:hypothetical protein
MPGSADSVGRASEPASLFFRRLAPVEAVIVNGIRDIVLHEIPGSVPAPQAYAASNTTQLRRTLTHTRSAN